MKVSASPAGPDHSKDLWEGEELDARASQLVAVCYFVLQVWKQAESQKSSRGGLLPISFSSLGIVAAKENRGCESRGKVT